MNKLISILLASTSLVACIDNGTEDTEVAAVAERLARGTADADVRVELRKRLANGSLDLASINDFIGTSVAPDEITIGLGPVEWNADTAVVVGYGLDADSIRYVDASGDTHERSAAGAPDHPALVLVPRHALLDVPAETEPSATAQLTYSAPIYFREMYLRGTSETGNAEIFSICNGVRDNYEHIDDSDKNYMVNNYLANTTSMKCRIMEDDWDTADYGLYGSGDDLLGTLQFDAVKVMNTTDKVCFETSDFNAIGAFSRVRAPDISPYSWIKILQPCTSFVN